MGTSKREAYVAYLKGRYHLRLLSRDAAERAIEYFRIAIDRDPDYAAAHAGIADALYALSNMRRHPDVAMAEARTAAYHALELDPNLAEAHLSLALISAFYDWRWTAAEEHFRRAIALNPVAADARAWYGLFLSLMGHLERAVVELDHARWLDPLSPSVASLRGLPDYLAGQNRAALAWSREALELEPRFFQAHAALGTTYEAMGDFPQAVAELERAYSLEDSPVILALLGRARALAGDREEAGKILNQLLALRQDSFVSSHDLALVCHALGLRSPALDWLERAYDERAEGMVALRVDPRWADLRSEPRFLALVEKMEFP